MASALRWRAEKSRRTRSSITCTVCSSSRSTRFRTELAREALRINGRAITRRSSPASRMGRRLMFTALIPLLNHLRLWRIHVPRRGGLVFQSAAAVQVHDGHQRQQPGERRFSALIEIGAVAAQSIAAAAGVIIIQTDVDFIVSGEPAQE